jgi:hypothetical protein
MKLKIINLKKNNEIESSGKDNNIHPIMPEIITENPKNKNKRPNEIHLITTQLQKVLYNIRIINGHHIFMDGSCLINEHFSVEGGISSVARNLANNNYTYTKLVHLN